MCAISAPTTAPDSSKRNLLLKNLGAASIIFLLLEIWRPRYFLTDDNCGGGFPLLIGMGRRLAHGKSPFVADYIFGGNYDLLRDCTSFIWHPIYLLASLLAVTPAHFWIMDVIAYFFLMVAAAGFVCLADHVRKEFGIPLGDGWLMFYTLSFTYSMIVLTTGSSWLNFLGNHSALPWLTLGILQVTWRRGLGLVALFSLHQLMGGHFAPTISTSLFLSLFAMGVAVWRRSWVPLISWSGGYLLALAILSPLLLPAAQGFLDADRSGGLSAVAMSKFAIPAKLFPLSFFLATFSTLLPVRIGFGTCQVFYATAFVSCAAAWLIIPTIFDRARWRGLDVICAGLIVVAMVMVIRPLWVSQIMIHLPLLKSMRWPFREILQMQFFFHLLVVLRHSERAKLFRTALAYGGSLIFLMPLPFLPAPTFLPLQVDQKLIFSGRAYRYWKHVRTYLGPHDYIAAIADPQVVSTHPFTVPFSLLGTYNFPILFKVKSVTGYSVTAPRDQLVVTVPPKMAFGLFSPDQKEAILRERPDVKFITLESMDPLRITLSSKDGPTVDLTPFIPLPIKRGHR